METKTLIKRIKNLKERRDRTSKIIEFTLKGFQNRLNHSLKFKGKYQIFDRGKGSKKLLIILAGYKEYLWPLVFGRVKKFKPNDVDVCVVSPGLFSKELNEITQKFGWSYLSPKLNKITLGLNLAIQNHPKAKYIYKIDEDIFISKNFFENLLTSYEWVKDKNEFSPGFCTPIININGFSYIHFLKTLNLEKQYKEKFGEFIHAASGVKAHSNGEAAKWLWTNSLPFDEVAQQFSSLPFSYSLIPHRFSIGAILFERELWDLIGGFTVPLSEFDLGEDERQLCIECIDRSRVMVLCENIFVGHFSFKPQESIMREYLKYIYNDLLVGE